MIEDREKRARIRSESAAAARLARAAGLTASAVEVEALEGDEFGRNVALARLKEAEEQVHGALALIEDCHRSLAGVTRNDESIEDRMVEALARIEKTIDDSLKAEVAGTPRDGLPFHRLDEARVLSPDILARVRERQGEM